jgi:hypothetical protein
VSEGVTQTILLKVEVQDVVRTLDTVCVVIEFSMRVCVAVVLETKFSTMVRVALVVDVDVVVTKLTWSVVPEGNCSPMATPIIRATSATAIVVRTTDLFMAQSDVVFWKFFKEFPSFPF